MPHGGLRRAGDLELGDHAVDAAHVDLDRLAVVAADGDRECDVAHLFGLLLVLLGMFVVGHGASIAVYQGSRQSVAQIGGE